MRLVKRTLAALLVGALATTATPPSARAQPGGGDPAAPGPGENTRAPIALDERELAELKELEGDYKHYIGEAERHQQRMRAVIQRELDARIKELEKRYAEGIAAAEAERHRRHLETVALLEKFIADYPDHEQFTPDAMFRLADLYLDESEWDLEQRELVALPTDNLIADYSKSLAMWQTILDRFPKFRQLPGTVYLLAHYGRVIDERRSLQLFLSLVCANRYKPSDPPPPTLTPQQVRERIENRTLIDPYADCTPMEGAELELQRHAWVRGIAEYHFSVPGELDEAISAYRKVVDTGKDSPLYSEALYKLSWSYYRRDYLLDAIKGFDESVLLYDSVVAAGGVPTLDLRTEALQYIAVAFTDPWSREELTDPQKSLERGLDFYKGREKEPHVRDVWEVMGNAFMEIQAWDQAVAAYRIAIGPPWELHPNNPVLHQEIVNAYEAKGDKAGADAAAGELATRYAVGTPWYVANEKDRAAMEAQRRIAEHALFAAARNTHLAATELRENYEAGGKKDQAKKDEYLELYKHAIGLYRTFLTEYPESDYTYEFTYRLADALFFSEKYMESVEHYRWVRDHQDLSSAMFLPSALSVIQAYEAEIARLVAAGELPALQIPKIEDLKALPQPIAPQPIPPMYLQMQKEWDEYLTIVNDPKTAPSMGENAALVSMSFLHFDDAIDRYRKVLTKFCGSPEAVRSKDGLLVIYDALGDNDKFEQTNLDFIRAKCGDAAAIAKAESQNRSIEFRKANDLFDQQQYLPAGESFYRYYKTAPEADGDLPIALYNAALSFKLGDRPKTAIYLFKEFTNNRSPAFRKSPFYLEALRLTAVSQQSVFDFKTAIKTYLALYDEAKKAKKAGLTPAPPAPGEQPRSFDQVSLDALYNAALLSELDRNGRQAIELYGKYEREETDKRNQDRALWSVARVYRSAGDVGKLEATYAAWRKKYGNDDGNSDDYVFSFYDLAKAYAKRGKSTQADKWGAEAVKAWREKGAIKKSRGAELAGEYALLFAERHFSQTFLPYAIKSKAKTEAAAKDLIDKAKEMTKVAQDKYLALDDFGVLDLSLAAKVRYGETLTGLALKLSEMPVPKFLEDAQKKSPDADIIGKFEESRAKQLVKYTAEARDQWVTVVDLGKQGGIANKWTQRALEDLNQEFPDEFKVLHQELFEGTEAP